MFSVIAYHHQHRAEYFFASDPHVGTNVGKHGWSDIEAAIETGWTTDAAANQCCALNRSAFNHPLNFFELHFVDDRSDNCVFFSRISDLDCRVLPAKITIIGGGVVGTQAARIAIGMGANTTILDRSLPRLRQLDDLFGERVKTRYSTIDAIEEEIVDSDAVIGAVLVPGASAPKLIKRSHLVKMKPGCVFVDVAIDQGGCAETSKPTTHRDPVYTVDEVIHYCVANMPGAVPLTSSYALNNATLPFGLALASNGAKAIADSHLRNGLNVHAGKITHRAVAESLNLEFSEAF